MSKTLENSLTEINGDYRSANYSSLQGDLRILSVALKQYNLLFNNLFKTKEQLQAEVEALVAEIPRLPENNRKNKLNSLQSKMNIIANKNEIATAVAAANVEKIQEKLIKYTDAIQTLIDAFKSVKTDIVRLGPDRLYKPSGLFKESAEAKYNKFFELLSNITLDLKRQKLDFTKLQSGLRSAIITANAKRSASQLQEKINRLRGIVGVPGLSAENQREGVIRAISKIQNKIGGGGTRKRSYLRKRNTRRN